VLILSFSVPLKREIETWNSQTSTICSEAVLLLTLDAKQFELEGFEIISNLRNKTEKLNKNTTKSSTFVGINGGKQNLLIYMTLCYIKIFFIIYSSIHN
jgi:hypothetical protein